MSKIFISVLLGALTLQFLDADPEHPGRGSRRFIKAVITFLYFALMGFITENCFTKQQLDGIEGFLFMIGALFVGPALIWCPSSMWDAQPNPEAVRVPTCPQKPLFDPATVVVTVCIGILIAGLTMIGVACLI